MKSILTLFLALAATTAGAAEPQKLYVAPDASARGPFTEAAAAEAGETIVTLTAEQYAQVDALRKSYAALAPVRVLWHDGVASLHPLDALRATLLTQYAGLSPGEQALFEPTLLAVRKMIVAGNVAEARKIIELSGLGMPQALADARTAMLAAIDAAYPPQ